MTNERNCYNDGHFPDHWSDEDLAFLADFVYTEFGAELVARMGNDLDYDYTLYTEDE